MMFTPYPQAPHEATMKRSRWIALIVLMAAMVAMLAIGFYRSVTHQDSHPEDSSSPAESSAPV